MRSSSISCVAERRHGAWAGPAAAASIAPVVLVLLVLIALQGCASGATGGGGAPGRSLADLTNPFLGPEYSDWLGGPIVRLASHEEVTAYLALRDDHQAADFIERFWAGRNASRATGAARISLRELFEERGEVADKKFSEAGVLGRRTDRGTIFILYGAPSKGTFEVGSRPNDPPVEVWFYKPDAPAGLDGRQPDAAYRFSKRGELTVFYVPRPGRPLVGPGNAPP